MPKLVIAKAEDMALLQEAMAQSPDPVATVAWRTPEEIIAKMPLADQVTHYKTAWEIMRLELEQARLEIERLKRAANEI